MAVLRFARASLACALALLCVQHQQQINGVAATPLATNSSTSRISTTTNTSSSVTTDGLIGWFNCSSLTYADQEKNGKAFLGGSSSFSLYDTASYAQKAQCAQYQAPLCHDGICDDPQGRTVDIFVKRVLASSNPSTKPNVWFFQGGPGYASPTMEYGMRALYMQLNGNVNVYTMDHRGTGRSNPLNCVAAQATTSASPLGVDIDITEFLKCAQDLQSKYGDMAAFSVTSAATDIASFIAKYQTGTKVFVYGVSYGTALVERLMHLNTPEIVGYVLDGVATTSGAAVSDGMYMSNWDVNFGDVGNNFLAAVKPSARTADDKFGSKSVASVLKSALSKLDKDPSSRCSKLFTSFFTDAESSSSSAATSASKPSYYLRQFLGKLLTNSLTRTLIPVIVYRTERCSKDDHLVLAFFFKSIGQSLRDASEEEALVSLLQYYLIVFSEMWEAPTPDMVTLMKRFTDAGISSGPIGRLLPLYCAFTRDASSACSSVVNATVTGAGPALAYKKDKYWNVAATIPSQASVLIFSGKLDPQTPHKYAERLLRALDGANKKLVAFEFGTHGALLSTVYPSFATRSARFCAVEVLASFVSNSANLAKISTSCVYQTDAYMANMEPDPRLLAYFGTKEDMYDGELEGHYTTRLVVPLIIAAVVAAAAAIWISVHVYSRYAKRKAAAAAATSSDDGATTAEGELLAVQSPSNDAPFAQHPPTANEAATSRV